MDPGTQEKGELAHGPDSHANGPHFHLLVYCDCSLHSSLSSLSSVLLSLKRSSSMRMALPSIMQCRCVLIPPSCATMKSQRSLCNVFFPAAIGPSIAPESMRCGTTWFDQKPMPIAILISRQDERVWKAEDWIRCCSGQRVKHTV